MTGNKEKSARLPLSARPIFCKCVVMAILLLIISGGCGLFNAKEACADICYQAQDGNDSSAGARLHLRGERLPAQCTLSSRVILCLSRMEPPISHLMVPYPECKDISVKIKALNDGKAIIKGRH